LTSIVKMNCSAILALLSWGWWFQYVVGCGVWTSQVRGWNTDGDRKWKSCDWSDTKVLAVHITLTLKVNMKCSAILALFSCGWWFQYVVGCGVWMSQVELEGWRRQEELEWYEGFGSSDCFCFEDELHCSSGDI
jgi:hypothetical protein